MYVELVCSEQCLQGYCMEKSADLLVYQTPQQVHPSPSIIREFSIISCLKFIPVVYLNLRIV